jgi:hypothetical protein
MTTTVAVLRDPLFSLAELESVIPLVRASVSPTPQYAWPFLKAHIGVDVVVKTRPPRTLKEPIGV